MPSNDLLTSDGAKLMHRSFPNKTLAGTEVAFILLTQQPRVRISAALLSQWKTRNIPPETNT